MKKVISATTAVRDFSEILNRVKFRGDRYIVARNGKPLAVIAPVEETKTGQRLRDLHGLIQELPKLKEEAEFFAADLGEAARHQPPLPKRGKWA